MKNSILLVTGKTGYLITSMKEHLEKYHYDVAIADSIATASAVKADDLCGILVYPDANMMLLVNNLSFVKKLAADNYIPVFITGSNDEMNSIESVISKDVVRKRFPKPIVMGDMIDEIHSILSGQVSGEEKVILLVDDSPITLRNFNGLFQNTYKVMLANSAAMAIKSIALKRPDLILLDYEMPVVNGKQMLEMLRAEEEYADIPVIFLTGNSEKESIMEVMKLNPAGYILKSLSQQEIFDYVKNFLSKK